MAMDKRVACIRLRPCCFDASAGTTYETKETVRRSKKHFNRTSNGFNFKLRDMRPLSIKQQANRIEKILLQATKQEHVEGLKWYADARFFASKVASDYDLTLAQVSQLISLLSPQKKWDQNKADVVKFLDGETDGIFSTKKTLAECSAVVDAGFEIPENRMKTFSFAKCIEADSDHVVIDRHAIKIAYGQMSAKPIIITDKRYRDARDAYNMIADKYDMKGHEIQAVTWVAYKRIVGR